MRNDPLRLPVRVIKKPYSRMDYKTGEYYHVPSSVIVDNDGEQFDWMLLEEDILIHDEIVRRVNAHDEIMSALKYAINYVTSMDSVKHLQGVVIKWEGENSDDNED